LYTSLQVDKKKKLCHKINWSYTDSYMLVYKIKKKILKKKKKKLGG